VKTKELKMGKKYGIKHTDIEDSQGKIIV
jgi:hypothetical protein